MPLLGDPGHVNLIKSMKTTVPKILGLGTENPPKAIVLVTAHWSERSPTISSGKSPKLLYDYGGFPPESYKLKYDAPGAPELAKKVADLLRGAGFAPELDDERGTLLQRVGGCGADHCVCRLGPRSLRPPNPHSTQS